MLSGAKRTGGSARARLVEKGGRPWSELHPIRVDLRSLRRVLRGRPDLLEALEAGALKASGKPGVNVAQMWLLARRAMYSSADVPVLGTREAAQNAVDACRAAIAAHQIRKDESRFAVTWDEGARTLTWEDNGIAMDAETILTKFLVLGSSGKDGAASSDVAAGGFGVAKAVILGSASKFRWEMHTRDNLAVSDGADGEVRIYAVTPRQGTRITVFDVSPEYDTWWDSAGGGRRALADRLLELLSANDLPGFTLLFNGAEVRPRFSRRGGSRIEVVGSWGDGTTATVKAYKRPDRRGAYWVRLNGLFQFKAGSHGDLGVDVVVDITTTVRPGQLNYPLNAGRDSLQGAARHAFQALIEEVERENLSAGKMEEDEVFEPEDDLDDDLAGDVQSLTRSLLDDPALARALEEAGIDPMGLRLEGPGADTHPDVDAPSAMDRSSDLGASSHTDWSPGTDTPDSKRPPGSRTPGDSDLPPGDSPDDDGAIGGVAPTPDGFGQPGQYRGRSPGEAPPRPRPVLRTNLPDDHVLELTDYGGELPWFPAGLRTPRAIRQALERAEAESPYELTDELIAALIAAEDDRRLTVAQLRTIAEAMNSAALLVAATRGMDTPQVDASSRQSRKRKGNPFGSLGALRVSRNNYDKAKARAFKRNPRRWLPALILWDTTLKLMAQAAGIQRAIRPGFILEDSTIGLAQRTRESAVVTIYLHPDALMEVVRENRERPISVAGFLHGVAAHELTHADGRMGDGHSQSFVSAREDLGQRTVHLLPQLAALAVKLLKLPEPVDQNAARAARLERQLTEAKTARDRLRAEQRTLSRRCERQSSQGEAMIGQLEAAEYQIRTLEQQLDACFAAVRAIGEESSKEARDACSETSKEPRAACSMSGSDPASSGVPAVVEVPPAPPGGDRDQPSAAAVNVLAAVRSILQKDPPRGLEPEYVARFFGRYHAHLARVVDAQLSQRPTSSRG